MFQEIYRLIQSCCYLHLQLKDSSYVEFVVLGYVFILGCFYVNFEQFCFSFVFCHGLPKGEFVRF